MDPIDCFSFIQSIHKLLTYTKKKKMMKVPNLSLCRLASFCLLLVFNFNGDNCMYHVGAEEREKKFKLSSVISVILN